VKPWLKHRHNKGDARGGYILIGARVSRCQDAGLRWCPVPGIERPPRPTPLAYAERGNPHEVGRGQEAHRKVVRNLHVSAAGHEILRGIDLKVNAGEVHAIMGPNGSGKSTLAQVLAGREAYHITAGEVLYEGNDLLQMPPEARARTGIFLAFQYPVEIPGVSTTYVLRAAVNATRTHRGLEELDAMDFLGLLKDNMNLVEMDQTLLNRSMNEGFSGGEKKRNEILQMAVLDPKLAILDETDSGLDIDALRIVATGINGLRGPERALIVITHYQRLLNYIVPDVVHVLFEGRIVKSGDKQLTLVLEQKGYGWIEEAVKDSEVVRS
jgi:Fe-S cluster assembly ATP-binding protein